MKLLPWNINLSCSWSYVTIVTIQVHHICIYCIPRQISWVVWTAISLYRKQFHPQIWIWMFMIISIPYWINTKSCHFNWSWHQNTTINWNPKCNPSNEIESSISLSVKVEVLLNNSSEGLWQCAVQWDVWSQDSCLTWN